MKYLLIFFIFLALSVRAWGGVDANFDAPGWLKFEGEHFTVLCPPGSDEEQARAVINRAERYYENIADDIGYTRYHNFWTWGNRVKVIIFNDETSYSKETGQPPWSQGFASLYSESFQSRIIVSYNGQPNFLDVILPHEITHLILHDFIGFDRSIPRFFDEGMAQLEQKDDSLSHMDVVARLISGGKIIPLKELLVYDLFAHKNDTESIAIFYVESLYIVDFLIKTYGKDAFREMCRRLRDGDDFERALKSSYYPTIDSMQALQNKWVDYTKQYL
ncbi:MAG: hypothetical protein HQL14_07905 [Candidatus Omnitrophica bacterium]|nr:hypothetical protein [Candidatus Omnitrophota bacterium]